MDKNPWAHITGSKEKEAASLPATAAFSNAAVFMPIVDDDDDENLQTALALSMHASSDVQATAAATTTAKTSDGSVSNQSYSDAIMEFESSAKHPLSTSDKTEDGDYFDCTSFHKLMWDDNISTMNDKERWIYECITTSFAENNIGRDFDKNENVAMKNEENNVSCSTTSTTTIETWETFISSHQRWGLTQRHGGPCGVLAAIQAEMIRILLWGRYQESNNNNSGKRSFDYPYSPITAGLYDEPLNQKPPTPSEVDEAMAMAMAIILARASIIPVASSEKRSKSCTVRLVFPTATSEEKNEDTKSKWQNQHSPWIEQMLNPSSPNLTATSTTSGLSIHSITASLLADGEKNDHNDVSPETKRPRKKAVSFADDNFISPYKPVSLTPEQIKITNLANAVSNYLLGLNEMKSGGNNINVSSSKHLDYFRGPGGVMFFVMSLVESRGIDRIKADMDDPNNKITSQFGHSSQELMNLLLTGQAVSNVFDNSMTLSEDFTCRGIQYRPAIGYLSQLESLRYCEVGSFYKFPIFPVWIVASTNHFSVVFGDSRCLQESKSDQILERCRRAFKKVEDGESGFIMKDRLGKVVEELDLMMMLGDNGVQTLAAYLEVPGGGGIVLWDDVWKACSRLMTGSSFQSIVQDNDDEVKLIGTIGTINRLATPPPSTMSSDEEFARKLAAEWQSMPEDELMTGLEPLPPPSNTEQLLLSSYFTNSATTAPSKPPPLVCPPDLDPDVFNSLPLEMQQEIVMDREQNVMTDTDTQLATADDAGTLSVESVYPIPEFAKDFDLFFSDDRKPAAKEKEPTKTDSTTQTNPKQLDFEKHDGCTFPLYHYNGLRDGCLTPFRVTRLSAEEAVGVSIALSSKGGGDSGGDLQDVIRTKWPSCMINWLGKQAPCID